MLKRLQFSESFDRNICVLLLFSLVHCLAILFNIGLPIGFVYGPFLYLLYKTETGKVASLNVLHGLPLAFFTVAYLSLAYMQKTSPEGSESLRVLYYSSYFAAMPVSFIAYSAAIIFLRKSNSGVINPYKDKLISQLCFIKIAVSLFLVFLFIKIQNGGSDFGFDPKVVVYGLISLGIAFMSQYLLIDSAKKASKTDNNIRKAYLPYMEQEAFITTVKECLESSLIYLNANLTLDMLADSIHIPKHHVSPLLNMHFGKNFYQLIAEYRIEHAKKVLHEDNSITIESLAYECGFHSKTSLNKYFKELTGIVPSQYRINIEKQEAQISRQLIFR